MRRPFSFATLLMKVLTLASLSLLARGAAAADDTYNFVSDFQLMSATMEGKEAVISMQHKATFGQPRFELIPSPVCAESYPAQCAGTLVRLDQPITGRGMQVSKIRVDVTALFGQDAVIVRILGPNKRTLSVEYRPAQKDPTTDGQ